VQRKVCGCDVPACHRPVSTTSMHGSGGRPAWPSAELCRPVPQTATQPGANEHRRQAAPGVGFGLTAVLWYTPLAPPAATPATLAPCAPLQAVLQTRCPRRNLPPSPSYLHAVCLRQSKSHDACTPHEQRHHHSHAPLVPLPAHNPPSPIGARANARVDQHALNARGARRLCEAGCRLVRISNAAAFTRTPTQIPPGVKAASVQSAPPSCASGAATHRARWDGRVVGPEGLR